MKNTDNSTTNSIYSLGLGMSTIFICLAIFGFLILLLPVINDNYSWSVLGTLGDTMGGFLNPMIAISAALLTFLAFYIQYIANLQIQKQFNIQKTNDHFYKMLDIHKKNVAELNMNSFRLKNDNVKYTSKLEKNISFDNFSSAVNYSLMSFDSYFNELKNELKEPPQAIIKQLKQKSVSVSNPSSTKVPQSGRNVFLLMIKDFHFCHYMVSEADKNFKFNIHSDELNKLAYKIFFWGTESNHIYGGGIEIEEEKIKIIKKYLSIIRKAFRDNKGSKYSFKYSTNEGNTSIRLRFIPFSGHASRLAHYYRHLYQLVKFIHMSYNDGSITELELHNNLNTLRAQFSNEEVLLLYYNYLIGFGKNWGQRGEHNYPFLTEYNLLHNIPLLNHIPKNIEHPLDHFREYIKFKRKDNPDFKMFEWE